MYISRIKLDTFRLFDKLELKLNPGLNVIVGENNSGKTALIDAIRLALDTNSSEWNRVTEDDFQSGNTDFKIELEFDGITVEQASVFVEHLTHIKDAKGNRKAKLHVTLSASLTNNHRRGVRFTRTELRSGVDGSGPQVEREIRNYLSATYLRPLRDAEQELSSGRYSRLAQILAAKKELRPDTADFESLLNVFIEASKSVKSNPSIVGNQSDIAKLMGKLTFKHSPFNPAIQMIGDKSIDDMNSSEKSRSFSEILERLSLVLSPNSPNQGLGYNNILFMATELLLLEQEEGQFPLLLIEEPEAHLHPQLQMKFLQFLRDWEFQSKNTDAQAILTTHSPNLASKAPLESVILMKEGKAFPLRKEETMLDGNDYVFLEKFLDVTKANLFFAKGVIIVEGDSEAILLPTIAKLLGRNLEDYGVSIVNVGSTAFARFAKIFLRRGDDAHPLPIQVSVLRDLDLWPVAAEEKEGNPHGFKVRKPHNTQYWIDPDDAKQVENKRKELRKLAGQGVRVFVSDEWTFEYSLLRSGLDEPIKEILGDACPSDLPSQGENRAIVLYGAIEKGSLKTDLAYRLSAALLRTHKSPEQRESLKAKLPDYILKAIQYATENFETQPDVPQETKFVEQPSERDLQK